MTPAGALVVGLAVLAAGSIAIVYFGRWALNRESERTAAATFEAAYIPTCADVAPADRQTDALLSQVREAAALDAAERVVAEEEMVADLESAIDHVEGGWRHGS